MRITLLSQIDSMGRNLITVSAGTYKQAFGRKMQTSHVTTLKEKDAQAIQEGCGLVKSAAPVDNENVNTIDTIQYRPSTTCLHNIFINPYITILYLPIIS